MRTYIIAEMSANHCGDKELAKKIIFKAKEDEDAKSLRINFENGVVTDAKILDIQ